MSLSSPIRISLICLLHRLSLPYVAVSSCEMTSYFLANVSRPNASCISCTQIKFAMHFVCT
jgi:hypothetical protein